VARIDGDRTFNILVRFFLLEARCAVVRTLIALSLSIFLNPTSHFSLALFPDFNSDLPIRGLQIMRRTHHFPQFFLQCRRIPFSPPSASITIFWIALTCVERSSAPSLILLWYAVQGFPAFQNSPLWIVFSRSRSFF